MTTTALVALPHAAHPVVLVHVVTPARNAVTAAGQMLLHLLCSGAVRIVHLTAQLHLLLPSTATLGRVVPFLTTQFVIAAVILALITGVIAP